MLNMMKQTVREIRKLRRQLERQEENILTCMIEEYALGDKVMIDGVEPAVITSITAGRWMTVREDRDGGISHGVSVLQLEKIT